jgi:CMP-N,N'-diacetyllegionaminic acid synthase
MIALIPARQNSKRFPGKNRMSLDGLGLLERTVQEAQESKLFEDVIVSTDDPELTKRALLCGASVPFGRPPELASDETSTWEVVSDAVGKLDYKGEVMLLQVTSPFRKSHHMQAAAEFRSQFGFIPTISITYDDETEDAQHKHYWCPCHPVIADSQSCENSRFVKPNGAIYLLHTDHIPTSHSLNLKGCLGYLMPERDSLDIDYKHQLDAAEGMKN